MKRSSLTNMEKFTQMHFASVLQYSLCLKMNIDNDEINSEKPDNLNVRNAL